MKMMHKKYLIRFRTVKERFFIFLITAFMLILACFSYDMADYNAYALGYERIGNGYTGGYLMELGYILCEKIGNYAGMSFSVFRFFFLGIAILLLTASIYQYAKNRAVCIMLLYIIYPFLFDIVQMRHFMASTIAIFALRFLREKTYANMIKYVLFILLASMMHLSALLYMIMLIVYLNIDLKKYLHYILMTIAGEIIVLTSISHGLLGKLYQFVISKISLIRTTKTYWIGDINASVYKHYIALFFILILLIFIIYKNNKIVTLLSLNDQTDLEWLLKISLASLCFIPLIQVSDHFLRLFRSMIIIINLTFFRFSRMHKFKTLNRFIYNLSPYIFVIMYAFMFLSIRSESYYNNVTMPILNNNYFIEWLVT